MTTKQLEDLKCFGRQNRENYLNHYSWMCDRLVRTTAAGNPKLIPVLILFKMQYAADQLDQINEATTYEEIAHITIKFED